MTPTPGSAVRRLALPLLLVAALAAPAAAAERQAFLVITSPADISDLLPVVEVLGRVADPAAAVSWSIPGTGLGGSATAAPDGAFAFRISTAGLHLTQSLRIVAQDRFGHSEERVLLLVDPHPGPVLTLDGSAEGSAAEPEAVIRGRICDPSGGPIEGWLGSFTWSSMRPPRGGPIEVAEDGSFSLPVADTGP
jgi:hypothetical protein